MNSQVADATHGGGAAPLTSSGASYGSFNYRSYVLMSLTVIYAMGVTAGGVMAQVFGGFILDFFTWREAFIFIGAPGILIGSFFC